MCVIHQVIYPPLVRLNAAAARRDGGGRRGRPPAVRNVLKQEDGP